MGYVVTVCERCGCVVLIGDLEFSRGQRICDDCKEEERKDKKCGAKL